MALPIKFEITVCETANPTGSAKKMTFYNPHISYVGIMTGYDHPVIRIDGQDYFAHQSTEVALLAKVLAYHTLKP